MKIIEEFIDSLFSGVVETSETKQLKADLLANAEDRYEDLLSQGKSENEAIGTIISEFGTIDELMEELNLENKQVDETNDSMNGLPEISVEEGLDYLAVQRCYSNWSWCCCNHGGCWLAGWYSWCSF